MNIDLSDTTTRAINDAMREARRRIGGPTTGLVLTLIIVTDEAVQYDSVRAATQAGREHPCRVLTVIPRSPDGPARLDAEVRIGETGPGETVILRLYGPLAGHADTVLGPLLAPDTPVVTWWPCGAPRDPSADPLGALAHRRVTDVVKESDPLTLLRELAGAYRPGDTDFCWTRLTPWRTLLAGAFDQPVGEVQSGTVEAEQNNPSAELLAAWLTLRLDVPVACVQSSGPGITGVRFTTADGEVSVTRPDGRVATLSRPGQPDRQVALHRRNEIELLAEELRRLDPDEIYWEAAERFAQAN